MQQYLRNIDMTGIEELEEKGSSMEMNPLQVAAYFQSAEALSILLRHLQILWHTQKTKYKTTTENIIHSKAKLEENDEKSSFMYDVMTNKNLIKAENLLAEFENEIHDGKSEDIKRCVFHYMGSSKESEEAVEKIMKIRQKSLAWPKDWWPILKIFLKTSIVLLLKLTPIGLDVTTDSILLVEYHNANETKPIQNQTETDVVNNTIDIPSSGITKGFCL